MVMGMNSDERKMLADALKSYHDCAFTPGVYEHSIVGQAALILENYVDVVRCKDCKHWHEETGWCYHHSHFVDSDGAACHPWESNDWKMLNADDFCSYGERKDNEAND
jgi:hypothetical protein